MIVVKRGFPFASFVVCFDSTLFIIHLCPLGLFPRGDERSPSREGTSALRVVFFSVHVIESALSDFTPLRAKRTTVEPDA